MSTASPLKLIRQRLHLTQDELAKQLGCTQGNVGHYERGQTVPPSVGARLIEVCAARGLTIDFNHIYAGAGLPAEEGAHPQEARDAA